MRSSSIEHLDRALTGPVLRIDRVVLDGWVEPQSVALLAVVERPLEGTGVAVCCAAAAAATTAAAAFRVASCWSGITRVRVRVLVLLRSGASAFRRSASSSAASSSAAISASSSARRSISSKSDGAGACGGVLVAGKIVLALELLDVLHADFELVCDPGVGTALPYPDTDLVQMWAQRSTSHERSGRLAHRASGRSGIPRVGGLNTSGSQLVGGLDTSGSLSPAS